MHRFGNGIIFFLVCVAQTGCERSTTVHDGDAGDAGDAGDSGEWDIEPGDSDEQEDIADPDISDPDASDPDITDPDGDEAPSSVPAPPAEILRTGSGGLLLRGVVLTPTGVLDPGDVLVSGNAIVCVDRDCSSEPEAEGATWIDTHGVISPGLVDAHNHLAYNFLPEWVPDPPQLFQNRYEWADRPDYEAFIAPYANHRSSSTHFCPAAKWGELRSLIHATTTVQGQSFAQLCIDWCVRNADNYDDLGYDQMRTTIASPRDITDAEAQSYVDSFNDPVEPVTRLAVHMAEGYAGNYVTEEFDSFAGRDPRANRHQGISLLTGGVGLLIHSIPLTESQLQEALDTDSKIVWSPSSNMVLYGRTAPIQRILQMGITVALGPDWTPAGEDEMLSEMRFAQNYGLSSAIEEITPERLWRMATLDSAVAVGLESFVGRLEAGLRADIAVFGRMGDDPYQALIDSRAEDVRLVLIDGQGWYGDLYLKDATARNIYCEQFSACELEKYLCVQESPTAPNRKNETLEDIRVQLYNILEGIGYPPEEQYGRGAELLPLVDCEP